MEQGYFKGKNKGELNKQGKYKQETRKQLTRSKRQHVTRETNTQPIYIAPKSTMFLGHIKPRQLKGGPC